MSEARQLKVVDLLAKEYEMHRNETIKQIEIYNQQNLYMQVFIAGVLTFAFSAMRFLYADDNTLFAKLIKDAPFGRHLPVTIVVFITLLVGATIVWYFISSIAATHYVFNVLRHRMRKIEENINTLLGGDVWSYESKNVKQFILHPLPIGNQLNPVAPPVFLRMVLLLAIAVLIGEMASFLLPQPHRSAFISLLIVCTAYFSFSSIKEIFPITRRTFDAAIPGRFWGWFGSSWSVLLALVAAFILLSQDVLIKHFAPIEVIAGLLESLSSNLSLSVIFSFLYSGISFIPFMPPSELPMILIPFHGWAWILLSCALGKALTAVIAIRFVPVIRRIDTWAFRGQLSFLDNERNWIVALVRKYSLWGYLACQAIPFFPMRSGLFAFAILKKPSAITVFLTMVIGTIARNTIMYLLIQGGLMSIKSLFIQ